MRQSVLCHAVIIDENGRESAIHLCSSDQVFSLGHWAESLDESNFEKVRDLFSDGLVENSKELAYQLSRAIMECRPQDRELVSILRRFRDHLGIGSETSTVHIEI